MLKRKRWAILAGIVSVMMVAAGCGDDEAPDPVDETTVSTVTPGVLTVGSDIPWAPFEFRDENDELTGFDVELVEEIASRLGLTTEWVETDFDTIFTQVVAGRFDMVASGTTASEDRIQEYGEIFSVPYFSDSQVLTVNTEETPDIQSVDDLTEGDTIAVQRGTTGEDWARENLGPRGIEVRSFPDAPDTYLALEAGNVTGVVFDFFASLLEIGGLDLPEVDTEPRLNLEIVEDLETGEVYGFPVNPENPELLAEVNRLLQEMFEDGTYQQIYDKWFPGLPDGNILVAG